MFGSPMLPQAILVCRDDMYTWEMDRPKKVVVVVLLHDLFISSIAYYYYIGVFSIPWGFSCQ